MRPARREPARTAAVAIIALLVVCSVTCFPDEPRPSFSAPLDGQQLDGRIALRVRTRSLMQCDSVVLSRDGTRLGLLSQSESLSRVWNGFTWPVGGAGSTRFLATAHNPWFKGACSVSCTVSRPCSLVFDSLVSGGPSVPWFVRRFELTLGHSYDIVLWDTRRASSIWRLRIGRYEVGGKWEVVLDSARVELPGDFLRFTPAVTGAFDFGWAACPSSSARFLVFDVQPETQ